MIFARKIYTPDSALADRPDDYVIAKLTASIVKVIRRVEIYEADGTTPFNIANWDARLVGGSISVDRDRPERRMCEITLDNSDFAVSLSSLPSGFGYDKILKAFWGIVYTGPDGVLTRWEYPVGVFMMDRVKEQRFNYTVAISGRDLSKKCIATKIRNSISFPAGLRVEEIIAALAANAGITKVQLPWTGVAYTKGLTFARDTPRWEIMQSIADSAGYDLFFRGDGYLTMRKQPDPTTDPLRWAFQSSEAQATLIDWGRDADDSGIYNSVTVVGTSDTLGSGASSTIIATAENTDPASPTRIALIGERSMSVESDLFTDYTRALAYAKQLLAIAALQEYDVSFTSTMLPFLEPGDIVSIADNNANAFVPSRYLLTSYSIPLGLGAMTGTAKRTTLVGSTTNQGLA